MGARRRARALAAVLGLALVLAGCAGSLGGGRPAVADNAFSFAIHEPDHLVPAKATLPGGRQVIRALYTGLVSYDPRTSRPVYDGLAKAGGITSHDGRTWTIKIRSGWTFHNGEPVTAHSFVDAWNYTAYAPHANANSYLMARIKGYNDLQESGKDKKDRTTTVSGLKAVDDTTIRVTLSSPFSQFPLMLGNPAFLPMAKECLQHADRCDEKPVGDGPYEMHGAWKHHQSITVRRYPRYQGTPGNAESIRFRIYGDDTTAYSDLVDGSIDLMDPVPPEAVVDARSTFGKRYIEQPSSDFTYLGLPLYDKRFDRPGLRKAFSMAIDRRGIVDKVFHGVYAPARSLVAPVVEGARDDPCGEPCTYEPRAARQAFEKAGGLKGPLVLWFNSGAGHQAWMRLVAAQLRRNLGISKVTFRRQPFDHYLDTLAANKVDGPFRLGWLMDYPSPHNYLEPLYGKDGVSNRTGYHDPKVDSLIRRGDRADSVRAGVAAYDKAEDRVLHDMPVVPLWFGKVECAHSSHVRHVLVDAFGLVDLGAVEVARSTAS